MRRAAILALLILGFVPAVEALTIKDLLELSRAGLGEEVLLALIEVDGGVYAIDTTTLKSLKEAGVSERVIVALVRSGRERIIPDPAPVMLPVDEPEPRPQVVVIEHHEPAQVREVVVPVPVYVPVATSRRHHRVQEVIHHTPETTYVPFQSGMPATRPAVAQPSSRSNSTYWGFGGQLRPDAWGQPRDRDRGMDNDKPNDKPSDKPKDKK